MLKIFVLLQTISKMEPSIHTIISEGKSDQATGRQRQKLLSLFHQPDIEFELKSILYQDLSQMEVFPQDKQYYEGVFEKIWEKRKRDVSVWRTYKQFISRLARVASILIIGLIAGYLINSVKRDASPVYYTSVAPKGSVSEMFMPDGTHVFLNSGSKIKYSVEGVDGMREVFLDGEAFFQVEKMNGKPFLVHTTFYDVRVTGTTFNVKAYAGDQEAATTLVEGSVLIVPSEKLKLAREVEMKPGEQLVYNGGEKKINVREVNTNLFTAWKDNKMIFVNMSMEELKVLLERKFGVEIEISDPRILQYHFDGTFRNETIFEILDIIKRTLPIQYRVEGQKIVINPGK